MIYRLKDGITCEPEGLGESTDDFFPAGTIVHDVSEEHTMDKPDNQFYVIHFATADGRRWEAGFEDGPGSWVFEPANEHGQFYGEDFE